MSERAARLDVKFAGLIGVEYVQEHAPPGEAGKGGRAHELARRASQHDLDERAVFLQRAHEQHGLVGRHAAGDADRDSLAHEALRRARWAGRRGSPRAGRRRRMRGETGREVGRGDRTSTGGFYQGRARDTYRLFGS